MLLIRRSADRGRANLGWLDSRHTFSFADYHDPRYMGYGSLRVINEDRVQPGQGFGTHAHRDMEIISYVLEGELAHRDSIGNGSVIRRGDVQRMTAGTGVQHSEFNPSDKQGVHLLQIWIQPDKNGVKPRYAEKSFASVAPGGLHLVTSKTGRDGSIAIHQDADLYLAKLNTGDRVTHTLQSGRAAWVHVAEGKASVNGQSLQAGDAVALENEAKVELTGDTATQVLLFDLN